MDSPKKHNKPSTTHFITKLPKKNMPEQSSHIIVNKKQVNQHLQKESKKPYKVLSLDESEKNLGILNYFKFTSLQIFLNFPISLNHLANQFFDIFKIFH